MQNTTTYQAIIRSPIGKLGIILNDSALTKIDFLDDDAHLLTPKTAPILDVVQQLQNYFIDARSEFDLTIELYGTHFQIDVWNAMLEISCGKTLTYGELAKKLKTSARAIGNACRQNPIPLVIPCHRITAANHLGGFSGKTYGKLIDMKKWLLNHERLEDPL